MFAAIGSLACMFFPAVGSGGAMWAGLLAIIGNVIPAGKAKLNFRLRLVRVSSV